MKTVEEARQSLQEARDALKAFNTQLTIQQFTDMTTGDPTTVGSFALTHARRVLIQEVVEAEEELKDAKKAEASE